MSAIDQSNSTVSWKQKMLPWVVCFSASLFFAYELLQLHVMNAISPLLMRDLGLNATQFGTLSSTYLLADVIFLLPAGILLDRFSVRKVILTALFLCILGTIGFCKAQTLGFACLCHFLSGIGNAFCFLSCMMLISKWFPLEKQAFVMGLMITMGMLGGVVAQLPFSILAEHFNWRGALFIDGLMGIGIFALIYLFVKDAPRNSEVIGKETGVPFWTGIKRSVLNVHNICCGLYTGFMNLPLMIISAVWGTLFLTQVHHLSLVKSSVIVSMICLGTIVGSPLFGWISDKIGRRIFPMLLGGIASIGVMLFIMLMREPSAEMLSALFFLLGFVTSSQVLGYPAITENNPPELTGTSMGIAALIIMGMPAFIQPLSGKLLDWGWQGALVEGAPLYALSDFLRAFSIFPIGFLLALVALSKVKESRKIQEVDLRKASA
ncbi:MAG: MFS transporter [Simkaniaceae bacterium]